MVDELTANAATAAAAPDPPLERAAAQPPAGDAARLEALLDAVSASCHKINNPLTSLLGRAQILRLNPNLDPQAARAAAVIEDSAKRLAAHVAELAAIVREGREARGRLNPGS